MHSNKSEYLLSQYRFTGTFVLRCTATNQNICCPSTGLQGHLSYDAQQQIRIFVVPVQVYRDICLTMHSNKSEYLLSQYRFTGTYVLRCTVTNQNICCPSTGLQGHLSYDAHAVTARINNRLLETEQQRLQTYQTHTACYYHSIKKDV